MSSSEHLAKSYLIADRGSFWSWSETGEVVCWKDGATIAFRMELAEVIERLAPQGLPPFSALLLLLAATRDNWQQTWSEPHILRNALHGYEENPGKSALLSDIMAQLDSVYMMDEKLRSSTRAKAELAAMVFEEQSVRGAASTARDVLQMLQYGLPESVYGIESLNPVQEVQTRLYRDLQILRVGLKHFDPEQLALRLRTGLEEDLLPADLELPFFEAVRNVIRAMDEEEDLQGMAQIARQVMAAMTLPRSISQQEELPLGGVSDISNRGPLDRLLLSELAYDDLTLSVRIANNEALYLRRESPPGNPPRHRLLLLDSGLRCWGIPRAFITAVGLALGATTAKEHSFSCWRAEGDALAAVDLDQIEGVRCHLEALRPEAHPGEALPALEEELRKLSCPGDVVLVTTEDTITDPDFRRALNGVEISPLMIATVNREGAIHLQSRSSSGTRSLRKARLDLDALTQPKHPKGRVPLVDPKVAKDLPAILSVVPFPLRLPHAIYQESAMLFENHGVLAMAPDRRLMWWPEKKSGAIQLTDTIPTGTILWADAAVQHDTLHAVVGNFSHPRLNLVTIDLDRHICEWKPLQTGLSHCLGLADHGDCLFVIGKKTVEGFAISTGERLGEVEPGSQREWVGGRGYRSGGLQWELLSETGGAFHFESLRLPSSEKHVVGLIERRGWKNGAILVLRNGAFFDPGEGTWGRIEVGLPENGLILQLEKVNRNGSRCIALLDVGGEHQYYLLDFLNLTAHRKWYWAAQSPLDGYYPHLNNRNYRNRFNSCCITADGELGLITPRGQAMAFRRSREAISLTRLNRRQPEITWGFQPVSGPREVGYSLQVAKTLTGDQIFLDSRGLLHIKSTDASIPELTLVLNDGAIAGWTSQGNMWGNPYYTGTENNPEQLREVWTETMARLIERFLWSGSH